MRHPEPPRGVRRRNAALLCVAAAAAAALAAGVALTAGRSVAEPTPPTTTAGSSTAPTSSAVAIASDSRGYPNSDAHCDDTGSAVAFGRTARALVAICLDRDGSLEYRGVRLRDEASLTMPAGRTSDGAIVATNDGVTYAVTPAMLLVSDGDTVLYRDAWVEFREPRFAENPPATASTSRPAGTPTVSTTTVTMTSTASTAKQNG